MDKEISFLINTFNINKENIKYIRENFNTKGKNIKISQNLKAILGLFYILFEILLSKNIKVKNIICIDNLESNKKRRIKYINYYKKENVSFISPGTKIGIIGNYKLLLNIVLILGKSLLFFLSHFFKPIRFSLFDYMISIRLHIKLYILLNNNKVKKTYIFFSFFPQMYLNSLYLNKYSEIWYILSNAPICSPLTHKFYSSFYKYDNIVTCSKYQDDEINILKSKGKIHFTNKEKWGNENINISKKYTTFKQDKNYKYDIGIFTQGYWARGIDNMGIPNQKEVVKNPKYTNPYHIHEEKMIKNIIDKFGNKGLSIGIFPHPLEIRIYKSYGLKPYSLKYMNKNTHLNLEFLDSSLLMEKTNIGVTTYSSIGIERLEFGFHNIFYIQDNNLRYFNYGENTRYGDYFVNSNEKLIKKIESFL